MVGVRDKDKVLLLEDPAIKEMKLHRFAAGSQQIGTAYHTISVWNWLKTTILYSLTTKKENATFRKLKTTILYSFLGCTFACLNTYDPMTGFTFLLFES